MNTKNLLQRAFASFVLFLLFALGVQAAGGFVIHKVDDTGKPVLGAVFDIYGKPSVTWTSNPTPCIGDPPVEKVVEGLDYGLEEFSFTMKAVDPSYPSVEGSVNGEKTVTINGSGAVEFGNITFTKEGTYDYTITENNLGNNDYTYDPDVYTVRYVVTNNNGKLESTRTFYKNGVVVSDLQKITFTNVYKGGAKASVTVNVHFATAAVGETWIVGKEETTVEVPVAVNRDEIGYEVYKYAYTHTVGTEEVTDYYYGNNDANPSWVDKWFDENFVLVQDSTLVDELAANAVLQKEQKQKVSPTGLFKEGTTKTITVTGPNGYSATHTVNIGEDLTFKIPVEADSGVYKITQDLLVQSDVDTEFVNTYRTGVTGIHQVSVTSVRINKNGDNYEIITLDSDTTVKIDACGGTPVVISDDGEETIDDYRYFQLGLADVETNNSPATIDITHYLLGFRVQ